MTIILLCCLYASAVVNECTLPTSAPAGFVIGASNVCPVSHPAGDCNTTVSPCTLQSAATTSNCAACGGAMNYLIDPFKCTGGEDEHNNHYGPTTGCTVYTDACVIVPATPATPAWALACSNLQSGSITCETQPACAAGYVLPSCHCVIVFKLTTAGYPRIKGR